MKICQTCKNQNADEMRFCLNCGAALPDAPVVVNFGGSQGGQSSPGTNPYGQSAETQFNKPQFQQAPQQPQNYSMVPPSGGGKGSSKKLFIILGGLFALFMLAVVAVIGIVGYNIMKNDPVVVVTPTPTVSPTTSVTPSPTPSKSPSPKASQEPTKSVNSTYDKVRVKFKKVWVDYNKEQDGEFGMLVHLKFEVTNMKDVDSFAIIYFQKKNGEFLDGGTGNFQSKDGRVAVLKALKPGFEPTVYEDLEMFVPYDSLNLSAGKYDLKMDIDLVDTDENFIQHMGYKEFQYEEKVK